MKLLFLSSFLAMAAFLSAGQAYAAWELADGSCNRGDCNVKDTDTGLIWSHTYSAQDQSGASRTCSQSNSRLPTIQELQTAVNNNIADVNRRHRNFGASDWFFWSSEPGLKVSLENRRLAPVRGGLLPHKFKCVRDGVGQPGTTPPQGGSTPEEVREEIRDVQENIEQDFSDSSSLFTGGRPDPEFFAPEINFVPNGNGHDAEIETPTGAAEQRRLKEQRQQDGNGRRDSRQVGWDVRASNSRSFGTNYANVSLYYETKLRHAGHSYAEAGINGEIIGSGAYTVAKARADARLNNDTFETNISAEALQQTLFSRSDSRRVSETYTKEGNIYPRRVLFQGEQQTMIGPIPVVLKGQAVAEATYKAVASMHSRAFIATITPQYAAEGVFSAGAGSSVASVGVEGQLNFASGQLVASALARPTERKHCLTAGMSRFASLNGQAGIYAEWREVTIETVSQVVDGVCRHIGGWLGQNVCEPAKRVIREVRKINKFRRTKYLFNWRGYGSQEPHYWLRDGDYCGVTH